LENIFEEEEVDVALLVTQEEQSLTLFNNFSQPNNIYKTHILPQQVKNFVNRKNSNGVQSPDL
jgi:hypothetical protein